MKYKTWIINHIPLIAYFFFAILATVAILAIVNGYLNALTSF